MILIFFTAKAQSGDRKGILMANSSLGKNEVFGFTGKRMHVFVNPAICIDGMEEPINFFMLLALVIYCSTMSDVCRSYCVH